MNIYLIIGNISIITSRTILFILSSITVWQWTSLIIGIHFLVMLGWIIEQKSTLNKNEKLDILSSLQMGIRYCFYFHYLENGNLAWRRRFFNFLLFVEGAALLILYLVNSRHVILIQTFGSGFVCVIFLVGILFLEYNTYHYEQQKEPSTDEEQGSGEPDSVDGSTLNGNKSDVKNSSDSTSARKETSVPLANSSIPNCIEHEQEANSESFMPLGNNKRETMCSIQDLLANTSVLNSIYDCEEKVTAEIGEENKNRADVIELQSNCSINEVGLPIKDGLRSSSSSSSHSFSKNSITHEIVVDPMCSYQCNLGSSNCNNSKVSGRSNSINSNNSIEEKKIVVESSDIMIQNLTENPSQISNGKYDYENIYDAVADEESKVDEDYTYIQPFMPKPLYLMQSINESVAAQSSSGSHDYENIPSINVYRANTGVRHWKTYFDIEDRVHDYSTFKERSEIQDSTLSSNLYANNVIVGNISNNRPFSLAEKVGSHYSMSLPDLSNIAPAACIEVEGLMEQDINGKELKEAALSNGVDPSNYETIWYEDIQDDENPRNENGPKLVIGEDGKIQESLCNLYYSRLSDLSSKYFAYGIKRHNSMSSLFPATSEEARNFHLSKPQLIFEVNSNEIASSLASNTSTPKGKKIESKRTQRSPLMKLVALSQNSLHEHTTKALQAGKRVFFKPRIHVITPKKETQGIQRRTSLKANFSDDDNATHLKIDPNILKKRSQLSPKDKLILSEASALIRKREMAQSLVGNRESTQTKHIDESSKNSPSKRLPLNLEAIEILDSTPKDENEGPQHSTPEGNRHLPQMSILSTISSVASPEEIQNIESVFSKKSTISESSSLKRISSNRLLQNGKRCSSKTLNEMSVIQEFEAIPSQV